MNTPRAGDSKFPEELAKTPTNPTDPTSGNVGLGECFDRTDHSGACIADGYGIRVSVNRGHLVVADGIGRHRRTRRYPKVGHGLDRLVIVGHTGSISLEAIRWLDRTGIALVHVDSDGQPLTTSARSGVDDARLRRAQALAADTLVGHQVALELLDGKLAGQATVARMHLDVPDAADRIDTLRARLADATDLAELRELEATAAVAYFGAWPDRVAITWARKDLPRIPDHWRHFTGRRSPLASGSSRRAADPLNAVLNYLYRLAETECRLACLTLGLDPGLGVLHADAKARDSMALDLIEPLRPHVEAFTIDLADGHVFRYGDFTEIDDGHCRVLPPLTHRLAETLPRWAQAVAPVAEQVAQTLAKASPKRVSAGTPLTSTNRRRTASAAAAPRRKPKGSLTERPAAAVRPPSPTSATLGAVCVDCGTTVGGVRRYCEDCLPSRRRQAGTAGAAVARASLSDPERRAGRGQRISEGKADAQRRRAAEYGHDPDFYAQALESVVAKLTLREIQAATGQSQATASRIRRGVQVPHPRHWAALTELLAQRRQ